MDSIKATVLQNVMVQENGIIRNSKGYLIGRLVDGIEYESEHVNGIKEDPLPNPREDWSVEKFLENYDIKGLAEAFAKGNQQWHREEWERFIEQIKTAQKSALRAKVEEMNNPYGKGSFEGAGYDLAIIQVLKLLDENH